MKKVYQQIKEAPLEEFLCLAVLIATGDLGPDATLEDASVYWEERGHCVGCPHFEKCLACIINQ